MNRWGLMSALALAAALLLAGCGGDYGLSDDDSADEPQITLEQIRAANDPRSLLEKHGAVTVTVQESDQNDAVTDTAKFQYTYVVDEVLAWYHYQYTENSDAGEDEVWGEANEKMYAERRASDDAASLSIHFRHDDKQYILDMMPQCPTSGENAEQTIDGCSEEDGAGGATEMGTTLYNWSYNEPYNQEPYKSGRYLLNDVVYASDDTRPACLLTVCLPAEEGGEDWWVNEYHVARGTYVNICCRSGCTLYADAALTQPIDDTVSIDTNGEEMTVYVVPDVPLN